MILALCSIAGNVIMFIPMIWKNALCHQSGGGLFAQCQMLKIEGIVDDFEFTAFSVDDGAVSVHFGVLYHHQNAVWFLSDSLTVTERHRDDGANALTITVHRDRFRILNVSTLSLDDTEPQNGGDIAITDHPTASPLGIVPVDDHGALLLVLSALIVHCRITPKSPNPELFVVETPRRLKPENIICSVCYHRESKGIFVALDDGSVWILNSDQIRSGKTQFALFREFGFGAVSKMAFSSFGGHRVGVLFGGSSPHKLVAWPSGQSAVAQSAATLIPQIAGIRSVAQGAVHSEWSDECLFVAFGRGLGGCIGRFGCYVPTESALSRSEHDGGYPAVSRIWNVVNQRTASRSLLVFGFAAETRLRALCGDDFAEIEVAGFRGDVETLSVGFVSDCILVQITGNALRAIDARNGLDHELSVWTHSESDSDSDSNSNRNALRRITNGDVLDGVAAVIVAKDTVFELMVYRFAPNADGLTVNELVYSVEIEHAVSCLKVIRESTAFGMFCSVTMP